MTPAEYLQSVDPILNKVINSVSPPNLISTKNVFHDLMSCIIEQQIHYRSTKRQFQQMLDKAEINELNLNNFSIFEEKAFVDAKISEKKFETIANLIDYWSNNEKDFHELTDEEVIQELSSIKGVGKWSIDMILIYTLQRDNIFNYDDFHIKQIMTNLYELYASSKLIAQMKEVTSHWKKHQSLAFLYLLEWKKQNK